LGEKMAPRNKTGEKSRDRIRQEILEDWADVRQWIDALQNEWVERQETPQAQSKIAKSQPSRIRKSTGK